MNSDSYEQIYINFDRLPTYPENVDMSMVTIRLFKGFELN